LTNERKLFRRFYSSVVFLLRVVAALRRLGFGASMTAGSSTFSTTGAATSTATSATSTGEYS
jgi:hypothetical protein